MSMMTATRKSSKSRPFTCSFVSMTIEISDVRYGVASIDPGEFGTKAFRLSKHSGDHAVYDVVRQHDGVVACDCPDYEARHRGNGYGMCKHGRALVELGLMPAPIAPPAAELAPASAPTPEPCCDSAEPAPCVACEAIAPATELQEAPASAVQAGPVATLVEAIAAAAVEVPAVEVEADPDDVESDPSEWPAWTDSWFATPTELEPDFEIPPVPAEPTAADLAEVAEDFGRIDAQRFLDASERLTLAELADRQVAFYRGWGNAAGEMFARALDELALKIRMTAATTPAEYEARAEVLEREVRDQWEAVGFEAGKASCPCHADYPGVMY